MKLLSVIYNWFLFLFFLVFTSCDPLQGEEIVQELPSYYHEYLDARAKDIVGYKVQMDECEVFF